MIRFNRSQKIVLVNNIQPVKSTVVILTGFLVEQMEEEI